jgi:hypothetical protein
LTAGRRITKRKRIAFWVVGTVLVLIIAFFALIFFAFTRFPVRDPAVLKALNAEARVLIAKKFVTTKKWSREANVEGEHGEITVRKTEWPPTIASLHPEFVTVYPGDSVEILTEIYFDGGWGYWVQIGNSQLPGPKERYEYLGENVYFWSPY